jgi:hypothetical protein
MNTHLTDTELQQIVEDDGCITEKQSGHLSGCSLCASRKNEYEIFFSSLKEMESVIIPQTFSDEVINAVEEIKEKKLRVTHVIFYASANVIAFVALLVTIFKVGMQQGTGQGMVLSLSFIAFIYVCVIESNGFLYKHKTTFEDIAL